MSFLVAESVPKRPYIELQSTIQMKVSYSDGNSMGYRGDALPVQLSYTP